MSFSKSRRSQLYYFALYLVAFAIPFPFIYGAISVNILVICWLLQGDFRERLKILKRRKMYWAWMGLFLLHCISYFYSTDKGQSSFDLETKLSFFIMPIIVGTGPVLEQAHFARLIQSFIAALTIVTIICLGNAFAIYFRAGTIIQFFYHDLVHGFNANAVYFAWYYFFSLSALLLFPWDDKERFQHRILLSAVIVLQTIFFFLLSSKTMMLFFFVTVVPVYLVRGYKLKKWRPISLSVLFGLVVILGAFILFTKNPIKSRYEDVLTNKIELVSKTQGLEPEHFNNLTLRLFLWKTGLENVRDHQLWWYGCGNGDVHILQKQKIEEYKSRVSAWDMSEGHLADYNLHNMYLQLLMMVGGGGLILFLLIMFRPILFSMPAWCKALFIAFHLGSVLFMMQEAALQTQAGIIYFTFFSVLGMKIHYETKENVMIMSQ